MCEDSLDEEATSVGVPRSLDDRLYPGLMAGDPRAWEDFYEHFAGRLDRYFQRNGVYDERDREDLTQETMTAVFGSLERFDPARGRLSNWVYGVARNVMHLAQRDYALEYQKEQSGEQALSNVSVDAIDPLDPPHKVEDPRLPALRQALSALSENDQEILLLRASRDEVTWKELAKELGISESGAKMRYRRARLRLKDILVG